MKNKLNDQSSEDSKKAAPETIQISEPTGKIPDEPMVTLSWRAHALETRRRNKLLKQQQANSQNQSEQ